MTKRKFRLPLNIQFFAEPPANPVDPPADPAPPEDVTLTQAELDKKIEAEADRKLAKALEKKQAEWQSQLEEKLAAERKTAEEYAKMTAKEKEDAAYKSRLSELEKREQELNKRQLLTQVEADLKENGLPVSFASSLLTVGDNEQIKGAINAIKKDFDEAVNETVKDKLRQDTPKTGGGFGITSKMPSKAEMARKARVIKN